MKSVAEQNVAELGGVGSVLSRQKRDHVVLDELLERLAQARPDEEDPVLLKVHRLVFPHAYAEETVLWPVIRTVLPDGQALTLRVEAEHQEINELVTRLESLEPGSAERRRVLDRMVDTLRKDVRDEEDELLPRLQTKLTRAQLQRLGLAWEAVRRIAPTRAHPIVSRRPPGNVLSALPLSLLDRCRDRVDARLHR
ncbi:MAG: hemerythrin domain-containing protein, partial [Proteobacteria bacterium]|nr:hemerythrin domain-containing protein [Pseudomonadota bacterium]